MPTNEYRLHIDIPMGLDEPTALKRSEEILAHLQEIVAQGSVVQYRLGNDSDRQKSNYFQKNSNGHVSSKKFTLTPVMSKTSDVLHYPV